MRLKHSFAKGVSGDNHYMDRQTFRRLIGPGLIFSGASIGTSHLVQSTRAGAMFGLALVIVIILANVLKYPAFRFGVDYAHATGRSLLAGYRELGLWVKLLFLVVIAPIVPIILAAVSAATAGIFITLTGMSLSVPVLSTVILAACAVLLVTGGYRLLDKVNAWLLGFLIVSTVIATIMVLPRVAWGTLADFSWTHEASSFLFIVALIGFMPTPIDVAPGVSIWKVEADRLLPEGVRPSIRDTRRTFLGPYILTAAMAVCFCIMGAGVMYANGIAPVTDAPGFAGQIVGLYRETLGTEAAVLAGISALSVMITTVIAAIDIYVRTFSVAVSGPKSEAGAHSTHARSYLAFAILFVALAAYALFELLADFTR
ncbi:MAG TPA: divalent metal cation transporter, partial [Sphingomonadaceae bacterium]|nr:divalent metal cation transporter [Sphingomonadaceae bacterium]